MYYTGDEVGVGCNVVSSVTQMESGAAAGYDVRERSVGMLEKTGPDCLHAASRWRRDCLSPTDLEMRRRFLGE